ncbi:MAG: hypothetical protein J5800_02400 [Spirochaetales bacterium]|nr:hypothetical protein [Spirochaetales bacterium]
MENVFSIFMLIFAAALLLYAGLMALTKDYKMLPLRVRRAVKPKDKKQYTVYLAKKVALVAVALAVSALVGFWSIIAALVVLVILSVAAIVAANKTSKRINDEMG